jgi:hypothetical protein
VQALRPAPSPLPPPPPSPERSPSLHSGQRSVTCTCTRLPCVGQRSSTHQAVRQRPHARPSSHCVGGGRGRVRRAARVEWGEAGRVGWWAQSRLAARLLSLPPQPPHPPSTHHWPVDGGKVGGEEGVEVAEGAGKACAGAGHSLTERGAVAAKRASGQPGWRAAAAASRGGGLGAHVALQGRREVQTSCRVSAVGERCRQPTPPTNTALRLPD